MPALQCTCGHRTDSASSNYWDVQRNSKKESDYRCYARYVEGKWEKGCDYDNADEYEKAFADKLIKEKS